MNSFKVIENRIKYLKAIEKRVSRRVYLDTSIEKEKLYIINDSISKYNQEANLNIQLIENGSVAFNSFRKSYGLFKNVKTLIALIGNKYDVYLDEKLGYYGELLMLEATDLNLGTCWVGGTFDRDSNLFNISENQKLICVITVGNVSQEKSFKERVVHQLSHRKTKNLEELYISDCTPPQWFIEGIKAVQKAPSAINRQPVKFEYKNNTVKAFVNESYTFDLVDLGIAKLHFVLAAGGTFELGNYGRYIG